MTLFREFRPIISALLRTKTGAIVIALQIAITLAVLCNALYIVDDRLKTSARPSGAIEDEVFMIDMTATQEITDKQAMQEADEAALRAIAGVTAATWASQVPLARSSSSSGLSLKRTQRTTTLHASVYMAPHSLVEALGLNLIQGRDFTATEIMVRDPGNRSPAENTVPTILSLAAAKTMFPDEKEFVGKLVYWGIGDDANELRIIGIVETLQAPHAGTSPSAEYSFITPVRMLQSSNTYVVRTQAQDQARVMAEAEKVLTSLRNDRIFSRTENLTELRQQRYTAENALSNMLIAVCVLMLLVTASGIVGMASLSVNQRRKQIGVRRALGASKKDILSYFISENLIISVFGIFLGFIATLALNQVLVSQLELNRLPTSLLIYGSLAILLIGILAVLGPAWRGASIPAAEATRSV